MITLVVFVSVSYQKEMNTLCVCLLTRAALVLVRPISGKTSINGQFGATEEVVVVNVVVVFVDCKWQPIVLVVVLFGWSIALSPVSHCLCTQNRLFH